MLEIINKTCKGAGFINFIGSKATVQIDMWRII